MVQSMMECSPELFLRLFIIHFSSRRYEGEFMQGWFHGNGIFFRSDGMKYEGEFRGGRIWGLGLVTFNDLTNGFPRNEGFFQDCKLIRKKNCPDIVQRAQKIALMARVQCEQPN
jgi:MORN repeat